MCNALPDRVVTPSCPRDALSRDFRTKGKRKKRENGEREREREIERLSLEKPGINPRNKRVIRQEGRTGGEQTESRKAEMGLFMCGGW